MCMSGTYTNNVCMSGTYRSSVCLVVVVAVVLVVSLLIARTRY